MTINTKRTINIFTSGHFTFEALRDNAVMLKKTLEDNNFFVHISKKIKPKSINLIYEGHHPYFQDDIIRQVKSSRKKEQYIVCTEELVGSKYLPRNFFTFNNHELLMKKEKKKIIFFHLLILHIKYTILKGLKIRDSWINFIIFYLFKILHYCSFKKYYFSKLEKFIRKKLKFLFKIKSENFYWKDRYNFFFKILKNFNGLISTYDYENYKLLKLDKYIFIPHLFSKSDKNNFIKKRNYKYDCIFTGQLTPYRRTILKRLKKNFKVLILPISSSKIRHKSIHEAKIFLGLLKAKNQFTSSTNRTYFCLKHNIYIINQLPYRKDYLDDLISVVHEKNFVKYIKNVLINWDKELKNYQKVREIAFKKYNNTNYKKKLETFFFDNLSF